MELALFRVAQEATNNAVKHARATSLVVSLAHEHETLVLEVKDDGMGITLQPGPRQGFGLSGMRERVRQVGGSFDIRSTPGVGTAVIARVPLGPGC